MTSSSTVRGRATRIVFFVMLAIFFFATLRSSFLLFPILQDNDWPLLMRLSYLASWDNIEPVSLGNYGVISLVLPRWLQPLFGSTLLAQKALSLVASCVLLTQLFLIFSRLAVRPFVAIVLCVLLASTTSFRLLAESEFADHMALALWLPFFVIMLKAPAGQLAFPKACFLAGLLLGLASAIRVHFQPLGMLTLGVFLPAFFLEANELARSHRMRRLSVSALGFVCGALPMGLLSLWKWGSWSPTHLQYALGQALFPPDDFDLVNTFGRYTSKDVLTEHLPALGSLILSRCKEFPWTLLLSGACFGLTFVKTMLQAPVRRWFLRGLCVFTVAYFLLVMGPAFGLTDRLRSPAYLFMVLQVGVVSTMLPTSRLWEYGFSGALLAFSVWIYSTHTPQVRHRLKTLDALWGHSEKLTEYLRNQGLKEPEEAFVPTWDRFLTDDPRLVSFYNFGYANTLSRTYLASFPPPPVAYLKQPKAMGAFLSAHGVRFVVLTVRDGRQASLLEALRSGEFEGFKPVGRIGPDLIGQRID